MLWGYGLRCHNNLDYLSYKVFVIEEGEFSLSSILIQPCENEAVCCVLDKRNKEKVWTQRLEKKYNLKFLCYSNALVCGYINNTYEFALLIIKNVQKH